jgi:cation transport ATPase
MIPLATGLFPVSVNPMIASIAMTSSSLTVVINSLRLMK